MSRRMASYRRFIAEPAVATHAGNLGTLAERAAEEDAAGGSQRLAEMLRYAGLTFEKPRQKPKLTFEEQLALVESGKARVVEKLDLRTVMPDMTLGGVADWDAF